MNFLKYTKRTYNFGWQNAFYSLKSFYGFKMLRVLFIKTYLIQFFLGLGFFTNRILFNMNLVSIKIIIELFKPEGAASFNLFQFLCIFCSRVFFNNQQVFFIYFFLDTFFSQGCDFFFIQDPWFKYVLFRFQEDVKFKKKINDFFFLIFLSFLLPVAFVFSSFFSSFLNFIVRHKRKQLFFLKLFSKCLRRCFYFMIENFENLHYKLGVKRNFSLLVWKGCKFQIKGRLDGSARALKYTFLVGQIPLQEKSKIINYASTTSFSLYGACGVKIWFHY